MSQQEMETAPEQTAKLHVSSGRLSDSSDNLEWNLLVVGLEEDTKDSL